MSQQGSTLYDFTEQLSQQSPEHLSLFAALTDDAFQLAFDALLHKALAGMEESAKLFQPLDEPGLSGVLRLAMTVPGLAVTLEAYSNGHADLTFDSYRMGIARRILGEAKIYDGPQYHADGLQQLLGYMTGRELRGLMVVYMRKPKGVKLMQKVRDTMDTAPSPEQQGKTTAHPIRWGFDSVHEHSSGAHLRISHLMCNLHVAQAPAKTGDEPLQAPAGGLGALPLAVPNGTHTP